MGAQDLPRSACLPAEGVDRLEWEYAILSDLEEYRAGRLETVSNEDLKVDLGLLDRAQP